MLPILTAVTFEKPDPVIVIVPFTQATVGETDETIGGVPELYKSVVAKKG